MHADENIVTADWRRRNIFKPKFQLSVPLNRGLHRSYGAYHYLATFTSVRLYGTFTIVLPVAAYSSKPATPGV